MDPSRRQGNKKSGRDLPSRSMGCQVDPPSGPPSPAFGAATAGLEDQRGYPRPSSEREANLRLHASAAPDSAFATPKPALRGSDRDAIDVAVRVVRQVGRRHRIGRARQVHRRVAAGDRSPGWAR